MAARRQSSLCWRCSPCRCRWARRGQRPCRRGRRASRSRKPKGRFFWFTFGICMVRIRYADQKLLCLQWKCGLGLEMALSVDARRGSAPCRWAFPCVLFIIKKCWNEILVILKKNNINHQNHSNNAKKQKKLSNDKTSTSGFVHNKPKEPSLWFPLV